MATVEHAAYLFGERLTSGKSDDRREVGSRPLAVGSPMSTAVSRLLANGRRLLSAGHSCFKYCFSYPV